jgi:hypothetical protein
MRSRSNGRGASRATLRNLPAHATDDVKSCRASAASLYVEKVRSQFLSLRHQISANRTASPETCENSADFTEDFAQESLVRSPQLLSIGAGECIFLHRLRTAVRSLVSDLFDVTTDSERAILNPSPSTQASIEREFVSSIPSALAQLKIVYNFATECL